MFETITFSVSSASKTNQEAPTRTQGHKACSQRCRGGTAGWRRGAAIGETMRQQQDSIHQIVWQEDKEGEEEADGDDTRILAALTWPLTVVCTQTPNCPTRPSPLVVVTLQHVVARLRHTV